MNFILSRKCLILILVLVLFPQFIPNTAFAVTKKINSETGKIGYFSSDGEEIPLHVRDGDEETPESVARRFFAEYGLEFGILNHKQDLVHVRTWGGETTPKTIKLGVFYPTPTPGLVTHVYFRQEYRDVPVFGANILVHVTGDNILSINSDFVPELNTNTQPNISSKEAEELAKNIWLNKGLTPTVISDPVLYILNPSIVVSGDDNNYLVWYMELVDSVDSATEREFLFIDAHTGELRLTLSGIYEARNRRTYDCRNSNSCSIVLTENKDPDSTTPKDVTGAHNFSREAYDYYFQNHNRDSLNNSGMTIKSYARRRCNNNAYWNGYSLNYCPNMVAKDIVAHEYTHGVAKYSVVGGGFFSIYQSGALAESISDIFGSLIDGDWVMGSSDIATGPIRDMSNPPRFNDPDRLFSENPKYYCGSQDKGGIHKNAGVINKAAYLISEGTDDSGFNNCVIKGIGKKKMGDVVYLALTSYLTTNSNFGDFYNAINDACAELERVNGAGSYSCDQVKNAMKAVEIDQQDPTSTYPAKCTSQVRKQPDCSTATGPTTTPGPTVTTNPNQPTNTPSPTQPAVPTKIPTGNLAIWTTALLENTQGVEEEVSVPDGSKLKIRTKISICFQGEAGYNRIDVNTAHINWYADGYLDSGAGCIKIIYFDGSKEKFLPLGPKSSPEGYPHVYTLTSSGKKVSTTIYVTQGLIDIPDSPTSTPFVPSPTLGPSPTEGPTPTVDPNITPTPTGEATSIDQIINSVSEDKIKQYLTNLVDDDDLDGVDELQTRYTPFSGNIREREYIQGHFNSLGIDTNLDDVAFSGYPACSGLRSKNIIGKIQGKKPNEVYLVTAHMDSTSAMNNGGNDPAPGADDNGSGTAVVMEIARVLKTISNKLGSSIEFILFSGEEQGLCGSSRYVSDYWANERSSKNIKGVVNLDMIGNNGGEDCVKFGYRAEDGLGKDLSDKIRDINSQYSIGLSASSIPSSIKASDHAPFWNKNIQAIFSHECVFSPVYHSTNDKTGKINYSQLTKTAKSVVGALVSLAMEE